MILVDLQRVTVRRPDRSLFEDLSLTLSSGDRLGIVGRNGTGKSTLLNVLTGDATPESGAVRRGKTARMAYLDQRPKFESHETVLSAVGEHWEASAILDRLGMGEVTGEKVSTLSGGQIKRVALARVLVTEADLLVLDEPTNHLDVDAISWLETRLSKFRGGVVLVTHDRHVLDRVSTKILELDQGRGYIHEGGYEDYLAGRSERFEQQATAEAVRRNLAKTELAWLRRGAPARTRKPKSRIESATALVQGGPPPEDRPGSLALSGGGAWGMTPRLGDKVMDLQGVGHRFGQGPWLFENLSVSLERGGRLGVVGPNGSGKSTLLEILAGTIEPAAGSVERGVTVSLGYYDQIGRYLDPTKRVRDAVSGDARQPDWEQARLMERFWFDDDAQWAPIGTLSGGERRRLQLLLVLASRPNVLLLDEPTNDLDLDTLRALEEFLEVWPGSLVVVSHDRAHLERTVEDVVLIDGYGNAALSPGGYAGYEARRPSGRLSASLAPPPLSNSSSNAKAPSTSGSQVGSPSRNSIPTLAKRKVRSASTLRRLISLAQGEIDKASTERDSLQAQLTARAADHIELARCAQLLAEAEERLHAAEERWLELSEELGN